MTRFRRGLVVSSLLITAFIFAVCLFFVFSASGSQIIFSQLERWVPGLKGELVAGNLDKGWKINDFQFESSIISISAKELDASWQLNSLFNTEFIVDSFKATGLHIETHQLQDPSTADTEQDTVVLTKFIETPLPLYLNNLILEDFVYQDSTVAVSIAVLKTAAQWQNSKITIAASSADKVDVFLKPATQQKSSDKTQKNKAPASQQTTAVLPPVFVPLDIQLTTLKLQDARYHQEGFDTGKVNIDLGVMLAGDSLTINQLSLSQNKRKTVISGKLSFKDKYPINLSMTVNSELVGIATDIRQVDAHVQGDLGQLNFDLALKGKEHLGLKGWLKPLTDNLPFYLAGTWQSLPQIDSLQELQVSQGNLKATGDLSKYQLQLSAAGSWDEYPEINLVSELEGNLEKLRLKKLDVTDNRKNELLLTGDLSWKNKVQWSGESSFHIVDLKDWTQELSAELNGTMTQHVLVDGKKWQLALNDIKTTGVMNQRPFKASGSVEGDESGRWVFDRIALVNGENTLSLNGRLEQNWSLAGKLNITDFASINKAWSGGLNGEVTLNGQKNSPKLALSLSSPRMSVAGLNLRGLKTESQVTLNEQYPGKLSLGIQRLQTNGFRVQDVTLQLSGSTVNHMLLLTTSGKQLASSIALQGSWSKNSWNGSLNAVDLSTQVGKWELASPTALHFSNGLFAFKSHCWQSSPTRLCFSDGQASANQGRIPLHFTGFDPQRLAYWFPDTLKWKGEFDGNGVIGWRAGKPDITLNINGNDGEIIAENIHTPYRNIKLDVKTNARNAEVSLGVNSDSLGVININADVSDPLDKQQLSGLVSIQHLKLDGIAPLVDALHSTTGTIQADGRLGGSLSAPLFYGQVTLADGTVQTTNDILSLTQINGRILVEGDKATLTANMKSGEGSLSLSGRSYWPDGTPSGVLSLHSDKMDVALAGYGKGKLDSDITLNFDKSGINIDGLVQIPTARIEVESLPEEGVELSDDVEIVRTSQSQVPVKTSPVPIYLNLDLRLGQDVRLKAMGLTAQLAGGLVLKQKPGQTIVAQGNIYVVNGRFKAYGQNLVIRTGKLIFNGGISQPYIIAEAIRDPSTMEDSSVTVGIKINSPMNAISAQIFSEPELPDTDKLSYLLRGKSSTSTTNGSTEEAMAAMMIGAGLGQANGVVSDVASTFGLKDASFDTSGSGTDTKVNLSAYLLKDLQISYGVGIYSAVSEVTLKYFFLPKLYLQAASGLSQAVDLFYKFEF